MGADTMANRKRLLLSVGLFCLSSSALGMNEEKSEKSEIKFKGWNQIQQRQEPDSIKSNKPATPKMNKKNGRQSQQELRITLYFDETTTALFTPEDDLDLIHSPLKKNKIEILPQSIISSTSEETQNARSLRLSSSNSFLVPDETTTSLSQRGTQRSKSIKDLLSPKQDKVIKLEIDDEIRQKFLSMQDAYNKKSMKHLDWLRCLFHIEIMGRS